MQQYSSGRNRAETDIYSYNVGTYMSIQYNKHLQIESSKEEEDNSNLIMKRRR
jgi:hypothetical protein